MKKTHRRRFLTKGMAAAAVAGAAAVPLAAQSKPERKVHRRDDRKPDKPPLFSGLVTYGNLVFVSGKGAHFDGDIKAHTDHVLNTIEAELKHAGSSMDNCLKCSVFLHDLNDYDGMNEVFRGRFGENPPVRTTVATYGGVPGNSLVEIDVIAFR